MNELHLAYLSLGSNIEPESNLPKAARLLAQHGQVGKISSVWETKPVGGGGGGNYLNACLEYETSLSQTALKENVLRPIETQLGRKRSADKFAPRTIDIDILVFDGEIVGERWLAQAFVVVPLAEILPEIQTPAAGETIQEIAARLRREVWMETRPLALG
ncbi:MAG: 2-amino-4-hydroxy-6-hydroxymethyldihydropteridine diphosphokinase [Anaerolineales bacterium]|nr:2-amino-4-hydroxy-6-hydroxymethyldihydropteridine diphosphokinase [Anaerolineales bacterium]